VIEKDALRVTLQRRIEAGDPDYAAMSAAWSTALRESFQKITI
jgi:putative proteasome-type protease